MFIHNINVGDSFKCSNFKQDIFALGVQSYTQDMENIFQPASNLSCLLIN